MPVHMRNGRAYGGIPNGTVKAETPSSVPTTVKQLDVVGAVGDIAPITIPEAVKFENGNTVEDAVENFAQIETSPTTSTHAVGTHLVWNGILYTVKTAIDAGENLVIDSNIERTYVADELEDLKNGLNVSDISSNFTIDSSYVDNFCANKTGKVAVLSFRIKASCPNNTTLVTMSNSVKPSYNDVVSPFFSSNGSIQTQGSAWIERNNRSVITYYGSSNMASGSYSTITYIIA